MDSSIPTKELRNERIELIPSDVSVSGSFITEFLQPRIVNTIGSGFNAIYDKVDNLDRGPNENEDNGNNGAFAGTIGFLNTSPSNLELGFIIIVPKFQRTHVASNAIGLLTHYFLDLPICGGLGMRRVVWKANSMNSASIPSAERMGFTKECIMR